MQIYTSTFINELQYQQLEENSNSSVHNITTRDKHHLHRPTTKLSYFQKVHFMLASKFSTVYHID